MRLRIRLGAGLVAGLAMGLWCVSLSRAETIHLQDGSTREGKILSQTDTEIVIEEPTKSGKSFITATIPKDQIIRIEQTPPAELEFRKLKTYQAIPKVSYALAQYDQVLASLQKFVADFPDSKQATEIRRWIEAWETEKAQVEKGLVKISDARLHEPLWLPPQEAQPFLDRAKLAATVQTKAAARQSYNAQIPVAKAKLEEFTRRSGNLLPSTREKEIKRLETSVKNFTDLATAADQQYKSALDQYQKSPDPLLAYQAAKAAIAAPAKEPAKAPEKTALAQPTAAPPPPSPAPPPPPPDTGASTTTIEAPVLAPVTEETVVISRRRVEGKKAVVRIRPLQDSEQEMKWAENEEESSLMGNLKNMAVYFFLGLVVLGAGGGLGLLAFKAKRDRHVEKGEGEIFFTKLASAFAYPFGLRGLMILFFGAIFFGIYEIVSGFGVIFIGVAVIVGGYTAAYIFEIVLTTANGEDEAPDFPDVSDLWDSVLRPLLLMLGTIIFCYLPTFLLLFYSIYAFWNASLVIPMPLLFFLITSSTIGGIIYFPMAFLSVIMFNKIGAVNPLLVIPSIFKVFVPYLIVCFFLTVVVVVEIFLKFVLGIFLPEWAAVFIVQFISLYGMMVDARLLGLLYRSHKEALGWFH